METKEIKAKQLMESYKKFQWHKELSRVMTKL